MIFSITFTSTCTLKALVVACKSTLATQYLILVLVPTNPYSSTFFNERGKGCEYPYLALLQGSVSVDASFTVFLFAAQMQPDYRVGIPLFLPTSIGE